MSEDSANKGKKPKDPESTKSKPTKQKEPEVQVCGGSLCEACNSTFWACGL